MLEILYKNLEKKRKSKLSNNSLLNTSKYNKEFEFKIDKNNFINEMIYIYKYYLCNENKKLLISFNDNINQIINDNYINRNFFSINRNELTSPKSYQKKIQHKTKTEFRNGKSKKE